LLPGLLLAGCCADQHQNVSQSPACQLCCCLDLLSC
jgi:hypothetical protein